jgi:hypothetical protein
LFAGLGLYYLQTGLGNQMMPRSYRIRWEGKIGTLIAALNKRFGKDWVDVGLNVLKHSLQNELPSPLVNLIGVATVVENTSKGRWMTSSDKRQLAVRWQHHDYLKSVRSFVQRCAALIPSDDSGRILLLIGDAPSALISSNSNTFKGWCVFLPHVTSLIHPVIHPRIRYLAVACYLLLASKKLLRSGFSYVGWLLILTAQERTRSAIVKA